MRFSSSFFALFLVACASTAQNDLPNSSNPPVPDGGPPSRTPLSTDIHGMFVKSVHPTKSGFVALYEAPVVTTERWGHPLRAVAWLDDEGREIARREATPERELLDVAAHPSGAVTILEAADDGFTLVRVDAAHQRISETRVLDPKIATDPPAARAGESDSPIERATHDVGRIAVDGSDPEGVFLGTRTGRHSVVAYRMAWNAVGFETRTRTLVVPAHVIENTALNGGTYDAFGQLDAHYGVFVTSDANGLGFVGVGHARMEAGAMVRAHYDVFQETLETDADHLDTFVTRVGADGGRLGTSVVGTNHDEQLYALRPLKSGAIALGRSETWNEPTGFDAFAATIDLNGKVDMRVFDVEGSDIAFDGTQLDDGALLVVGAAGYTQNPSGASISETSRAFVRRIEKNDLFTNLSAPDAVRHAEARSLFLTNDGWAIAGMTNGPGTHSADADRNALRADGFVRITR